jgi:SAM-dependent methyltransferase
VTSQAGVPDDLKPAIASAWRRFYPTYREDAFITHVTGMVLADMEVLEIGAGSGRGLQAVFPLKGACRRYVGIDLDPRVMDNPQLDEAHVCDADSLPFVANRFDLVFHSFVAEHLKDPERTFAETMRVLKPGGSVVFTTPSKYYYPMMLAQMTPTWVHALLVKRLGSGRVSADVFPTFYRINTMRSIRACAARVGASVEVSRLSTPPGYLRRSLPLFLAGVLYERTFESLFPPLRAVMWVTMTKRAG